MTKKVTLNDLEISFGVKKKNFSNKFIKIFKKSDFRYDEINKEKEIFLIKSLVEKIINDRKEIGSKKRKIVWENGWNENYKQFKKAIEKKRKVSITEPIIDDVIGAIYHFFFLNLSKNIYIKILSNKECSGRANCYPN